MVTRVFRLLPMLARAVACLVPLAACERPPAVDAPPVVRIDAGQLRGMRQGDVESFRGIPYAAPPVGDLRWRPPRPVVPWRDVRGADAYGHDCVQLPIPGDAGASGTTRDEDCLVLNVWRPAGRTGQRLPVMVWIHGGGFLNGAASVPFFDGSAFARQGIVLVSVNYRLGRLGFFAHPALTAENDRPLANYALLDQLAALRWVQRNIGTFGGDSAQVTVVGESAGGISVVHLLTWPAARGLFHRAAVLSGGGRTFLMQPRRLAEPTVALPSAEESGVAFARGAGIADTGAAALTALRALPVERVNGDMSMAALLTRPPTYAGGPILDGEVVTAQPGRHFASGSFARVPLLVGTTGDDLGAELPPNPARPLDWLGADAGRARTLYDPDGTIPLQRLAMLVAVDRSMHEPARYLARTMTAAGQPAWLYRFDYVTQRERPKVASTPHAGELAYLFDQLAARYDTAVTEQDREVARTFHRFFVNFVKGGDPNGEGLPRWERFDPARFDLMFLAGTGEVAMREDPWRGRITLVERAQDRASVDPLPGSDAKR